MSRTYRQNPKHPLDYRIDFRYDDTDRYYESCLWIPVAIGGWREAKRRATQEDYAKLRKKRGDCFTKDYRCAGVPHWFRREIEKQHRIHTKRELIRYKRNPDYEVMIRAYPDSVDWWYWY